MEGLYFEKVKNSEKTFLCIYDISDEKRRRKIAKLMEGYGKRIQYSAFECYVSKSKYASLVKQIPKLICEEDSVRIYPMFADKEIMQWGSKIHSNCDVWIV